MSLGAKSDLEFAYLAAMALFEAQLYAAMNTALAAMLEAPPQQFRVLDLGFRVKENQEIDQPFRENLQRTIQGTPQLGG